MLCSNVLMHFSYGRQCESVGNYQRRAPQLWLRSVLMKVPAEMISNTLLVAWRAWYARNEITHNKPLPPVESSRRFLCSYTNILRNIQNTPTEQALKGKQLLVVPGSDAGMNRKRNEPPDKPWTKPPMGWVKLTIDGSFKVENGTAGAGMILLDADGGIIFSACRSLHSCEEALEAELRSCLEGLELSFQHSQLPIIIDSDCSQLVATVGDNSQNRSPFLHIISEIKLLAGRDRECKFVKVDRGQVREIGRASCRERVCQYV